MSHDQLPQRHLRTVHHQENERNLPRLSAGLLLSFYEHGTAVGRYAAKQVPGGFLWRYHRLLVGRAVYQLSWRHEQSRRSRHQRFSVRGVSRGYVQLGNEPDILY